MTTEEVLRKAGLAAQAMIDSGRSKEDIAASFKRMLYGPPSGVIKLELDIKVCEPQDDVIAIAVGDNDIFCFEISPKITDGKFDANIPIACMSSIVEKAKARIFTKENMELLRDTLTTYIEHAWYMKLVKQES